MAFVETFLVFFVRLPDSGGLVSGVMVFLVFVDACRPVFVDSFSVFVLPTIRLQVEYSETLKLSSTTG